MQVGQHEEGGDRYHYSRLGEIMMRMDVVSRRIRLSGTLQSSRI